MRLDPFIDEAADRFRAQKGAVHLRRHVDIAVAVADRVPDVEGAAFRRVIDTVHGARRDRRDSACFLCPGYNARVASGSTPSRTDFAPAPMSEERREGKG